MLSGAQRSVQVDQQARVAGRQQWRVEPPGKLFGQRQGADIPGDVFFRRGLVQAEALQLQRDVPAGVLADQDHRAAPFGLSRR